MANDAQLDEMFGKGPFQARWWLGGDDDAVANGVQAVYAALRDNDNQRRDANLHHQRLYGNLPVEGTGPASYNRVANKNRVTFNVIANVVDYATARIGSIRPLPKPQTVAGNHSLRKKAKLLERFFQAQFRISDVHFKGRGMFRDAAVWGTGVLKCYADFDRNKIAVERVRADELVVDHHEALNGEPRQIIQRKWVSRDVLKEMFLTGDGRKDKKLSEVLDKAGSGLDDTNEAYWQDSGVHDQVLVLESWHLPSGPKAKDGKHAIVVDSGPLLVEEWEHDYFPFVFFHWKRGLDGFWGHGLAEELNGIQVEINRLLQKIQTAFHLLALPRIFLDAGSKVKKAHINNEIGAFVPYVGTPPIIQTPQTIHPEIFAHLDRLNERAYEIAGFSQDAAAPDPRTISGLSAQTQHEISSERFRVQILDFEHAIMKLADQMIDRAKDLHRVNGKFAFPGEKDRGTIEHIDWGDVDMSRDQYVLHTVSQSALPSLPGAKMDRVFLLMQNGLIDPATAKQLLDFPDLEAAQALDQAAAEDIERIIENILDEGKYEPPEPAMDLQLAFKKAQMHLNLARRNGVDEEKVELLRQWITQIHRLQQKAAAEQQKISMAAGAAGGAMGGPPGGGLPLPAAGAPPAPGIQGAPPTAVAPQDGNMNV